MSLDASHERNEHDPSNKKAHKHVVEMGMKKYSSSK